MELEKISFGKTAWDVIDAALITTDAKQSARDYWLGRCVMDIAERRLWDGTEEAWLEWSRGRSTHAITLAVKSRKAGDRPTDPPDPNLFRVKLALECTSEEYAFLKAVILHMRESLGDAADGLSEAALSRSGIRTERGSASCRRTTEAGRSCMRSMR